MSLPRSPGFSRSKVGLDIPSEEEVIQKAQQVVSSSTKSLPKSSRLDIIEDFVLNYNLFLDATSGSSSVVSEEFRESICQVVKTIGGYDSPLIFTPQGLYYIPELWRLITKRLRESGNSAFKLHRIWFAMQGETVRLPPRDLLLIKIDTALKMTDIPLSCRIPFFTMNPQSKIASRGFNHNVQYQKALKSLLVPAAQANPDLKRWVKDSNGKFLRVLTYVKQQAGFNAKKRLFTLHYDEELISSTLRLSFQELAVRRTEATDLVKLFSSNPTLWGASRNPYEKDFTFLVAVENKTVSWMKQITQLQHESWVAEATSPWDLLAAARAKWPFGTLGPVVDTRQLIQLSVAEVLESFPIWTYQEALQTGYFDRYLQKKKPLPTAISELLVETGGGPLNFFLQALWANSQFRHAVNEKKCLLSSTKEARYTPSEFIGNKRVGKCFGKVTPGQTTVFYPDGAAHNIPDVGNVEFVLFKNASEVASSLIVLDELKAINTVKTPYRTFQITVYTNNELSELNRKTGMKFDRIQERIRAVNADGILIFSYSDDVLMDLDWLGEVINAGFIKWRNEYYRQDPPEESIDTITHQIIRHMQEAQPFANYDPQIVKRIVSIMDFSAATNSQFIETLWWHWVWEWISCKKILRQIGLETG